jgi:hypothetical protein
MALPPASTERVLKHQRLIDVRVYACGQGRWEVDAHITDLKAQAVKLRHGLRAAGEPLHQMLLRLVVDEKFNILEAGATTAAMPYPGHCDQYGDAYGRLVGLNLIKGFRQGVRERLGGVLGCTHITELAQTLPTAVLQGFAGEAFETPSEAPGDRQPFQFDRCHALSVRGEVVRLHYPRWYRAPDPSTPSLASASPSTLSLEPEQESPR